MTNPTKYCAPFTLVSLGIKLVLWLTYKWMECCFHDILTPTRSSFLSSVHDEGELGCTTQSWTILKIQPCNMRCTGQKFSAHSPTRGPACALDLDRSHYLSLLITIHFLSTIWARQIINNLFIHITISKLQRSTTLTYLDGLHGLHCACV
jgi:hypothetical protein